MFYEGPERHRGSQVPSHAQEFQVVILAGYGNSLSPLTDDPNTPKALLPIANRPMISYPLEWCEDAGLNAALVLCHQENYAKIHSYAKSEYGGSVRITVEAPSKLSDNMGTADVLRQVKHKVKCDLIVLSCDSCTNAPPHELLDFYRLRKPTALVVLHDLSKNEGLATSKEIDSRQFIGVDPESRNVLYLKSAADLGDEFTIRKSLLWKHPKLSIHTNLRDAHVYVFQKWVVDFIADDNNISSIKEDLLPILAKAQYQSGLRKRANLDQYLGTAESGEKLSLSVIGQTIPQEYGCLRANNVPSYIETNRYFSKLAEEPRIAAGNISPKSVIGGDSLVGASNTIQERCNIKRSVLGKQCMLGKGVNITNSVLMDRVKIEDFARIENCILCSGAIIGQKAKLTNCNVGHDYHVESEMAAKNENLVEMEDIMTDSE